MLRSLPYLIMLICTVVFSQEKKTYKINTIAFYNLENLFDPEDDPKTFDDDRTPNGKDHWTYDIYAHKLKNMADAISKIGADLTKNAPVVLGVAEIENRKVLEDLVNEKVLQSNDYGIAHVDSPDRRGIDVALLYQKTLFKLKNIKTHVLLLYDHEKENKRMYTRDQLVVSGYLDGDLIHIIVNHWPSRRGGEARSRQKRIQAAIVNKKIIDSLFAIDPYAKIVTMGDFNDEPNSPSIKKILKPKSNQEDVALKGLYNPMIKMSKKGVGSLAWRDTWTLFDQIILSKGLLDTTKGYRYYKAGVFNKDFLTTQKGKYKGYPFRSYSSGQYTGGYSDHFPVYVYLIKEE